MKVKALKTGYFSGRRVYKDEVFDMPEKIVYVCDEKGKPILEKGDKVMRCQWVEAAGHDASDSRRKMPAAPPRDSESASNQPENQSVI